MKVGADSQKIPKLSKQMMMMLWIQFSYDNELTDCYKLVYTSREIKWPIKDSN